MRKQLPQTFRQSQQGVTLMVVLMLFLMISILGAIALKHSTTDLKMSTGDQMNTLLLQSSDSAINKLEEIIENRASNPSLYQDLVDNSGGAFGHFILEDDAKFDTYSYCFTPKTNYLLNNATVGRSGGIVLKDENNILKTKIVGLANGSCYKNNKPNFTTSMNSVVTQVTIKLSNPNQDNQPFSHLETGTNVTDKMGTKHVFDIYATSAIPSYGKSIKSDYTHNIYSDPQALIQYMKDKSTPYVTVYSQVAVFRKTELAP